jgi:oxygen-independent coproporphyrinogen-3 oxidase
VAEKDNRIGLYLEALATEMSTLGKPEPVETLFIGGGTPTHLNPDQLQILLSTVRRFLPLAANGEFTIEANPGTLEREKIEVLAGNGVTRVSLGAQSFQSKTLQILERQHDAEDIRKAVETVRELIPDVSVDLIFGVPGQTVNDWHSELDAALGLQLDHVSTYGLTYEKGTRLWKQRRAGLIIPLSEDDELAMYVAAMDMLEQAGLEQYEISSFAKPGKRCRHNQAYWANEAYFGFGMGAASYVDGCRKLNSRDLETYLRLALSGETTAVQAETLEPLERAQETMAVQLRRAEGIERDRFHVQTGFELDSLVGPALKRQMELGLLKIEGRSVYLTRAGKCVADAVIAALL